MLIKILSNMESSVYVDDKYVGIAYANKLFQHEVVSPSDYYIKLVEIKTDKKWSLSQIAHVRSDVLLQFDFSEVLLDHQDYISIFSGLDEPEKDLFFKTQKNIIEVWSSQYSIRLTEIENLYDKLIPFGYHYPSKEYLLKAYSRECCYIINLYGKKYIEISCGDIVYISDCFSSGVYRYKGKFGFFEKYGDKLSPAEFTLCQEMDCDISYALSNSVKHSFIFMDGSIVNVECDNIEVHDAWAKLLKGNKFGIYKGGKVLPCIYDAVDDLLLGPYNDEDDYFVDFYKVKINNKWGIIDNNLNYIAECIYDNVDEIHGNYFLAENEGLYTLLNIRGEQVLNTWYQSIITPLHYCEYIAQMEAGEDIEETVPYDINHRFLILCTNSEMILLDTNTNKIIQGGYYKYEFQSFHKYDPDYNRYYSYILAYNNNKVSLIVDGKLILDSVDDIWYVYPTCDERVNLFVFKTDDNIGVVNCLGRIIIPPSQDEVRIESAKLEDKCDHVFYIWKNHICHCYDRNGKFIKKYPKNQEIKTLRYFDDATCIYHEIFYSGEDEINGAGWKIDGTLY